MFGIDVIVGGIVVCSMFGLALAAATLVLSRDSTDDDAFRALVHEAAERYTTSSITALRFARGKMRGDPVYRAIACGALLPSGGTLVDVGCGQGLTLALLAESARRFRAGAWPARWPPPPMFDRQIGIEVRPRPAAIARTALAAEAEIIEADVRTRPHPPCHAVLYLDVLQMMPRADQNAAITASAAALEPGGVILVRDVDASAGWRFLTVRAGNRLKAVAFGSWGQQFCYRSAEDWLACFASHGLSGDVRPMSSATFANVLFRLTKADQPIRPA
jgi:SAM-dependent methyltransferase